MSLPVGLILEALVAVLLVLTLIYCFILDRRLRDLRSGQDGLRQLVSALDSATDRAQTSIGLLRQASENAGNDLRETVGPARALADELSLMIESGNNLADRLEGRRKAAEPAPNRPAEAGAAARAPSAPSASSAPSTSIAPDAMPATAAPSPAAPRDPRASEREAGPRDAADTEDYENRLLKALRDAR